MTDPLLTRRDTAVCSYCGQAEGHSPRCSVTKFGAPDIRHKATLNLTAEEARHLLAWLKASAADVNREALARTPVGKSIAKLEAFCNG